MGGIFIFDVLSVFWEAAANININVYLFSRKGTILYMVVSFHEMNPLSLGFLALVVGMQHLVVFVKYRYKHLHSFLLVVLEVWFQLESYYALTFATTTARVGIGMLLLSHYSKFLIIVVALVSLLLCLVLILSFAISLAHSIKHHDFHE